MRILLICGLLLTLPTMQGFAKSKHSEQEAFIPEGPKIRVLLQKEIDSVLLEAKGPYRVVRKDTNKYLSSGKKGKRFVVHALQNGLRWGEEYPDVYQISLIPTAPHSSILVDGIQYKGSMSIYHVRDHNICIVNEVALEDYLKSTLPLKCDLLDSKEALCALAILARTEVYQQCKKVKANRPWEITAHDAEYLGYGVTKHPNKLDEAIDWTRFMVLDCGPSTDFEVLASKAEALAHKGLDARNILSSIFPDAKMTVTINPDEVALR